MAPHLTLLIDRVLNLPRTDLIGYCDPFVKVIVGGVSARTTTIENTSELSNPEVPVWNQRLSLSVPAASSAKTLDIELWDEDTFSNELIARGSIWLDRVKDYTQTDASDDLLVSLPLELAKGVKPCAHGAPVLMWRVPQWRPASLGDILAQRNLLAFDALTKLIQDLIANRPNEYGTLNPKWSQKPDIVSIPCQDVDDLLRLSLEYDDAECALIFRCMTITSQHDNLFLFVFPTPEVQVCEVFAASRPFVSERGHEFTRFTLPARHFNKISDLWLLSVARTRRKAPFSQGIAEPAHHTHTPISALLSEHGIDLSLRFEQLQQALAHLSLGSDTRTLSVPLPFPDASLRIRFNQDDTLTFSIISNNAPYIFDFVPTEAVLNAVNGSQPVALTKDQLGACVASGYPTQERRVVLCPAQQEASSSDVSAWNQTTSITVGNGDPLPAIVSYLPVVSAIAVLHILPLHGFHPTPKATFDQSRPYLLAVEVLSAANVPKADVNSESDPFVQVTLDQQVGHTPAQRDTAYPCWASNNSFVFGIPPQAVDGSWVSFALFDRDTLQDEILASASLPLGSLAQCGPKTLPLTLDLRVAAHPRGPTTVCIESQAIAAFSTLKSGLLKHYPQLLSDDAVQALCIPLERVSKRHWLSLQYYLKTSTLSLSLNDAEEPAGERVLMCLSGPESSYLTSFYDDPSPFRPGPLSPYHRTSIHAHLSHASKFLNEIVIQAAALEVVEELHLSNLFQGLLPSMTIEEVAAMKQFDGPPPQAGTREKRAPWPQANLGALLSRFAGDTFDVNVARRTASCKQGIFEFKIDFSGHHFCVLSVTRALDENTLFDFKWAEQAHDKSAKRGGVSTKRKFISRSVYTSGGQQEMKIDILKDASAFESWPVLKLYRLANPRTWSLVELAPALVQAFNDVALP